MNLRNLTWALSPCSDGRVVPEVKEVTAEMPVQPALSVVQAQLREEKIPSEAQH